VLQEVLVLCKHPLFFAQRLVLLRKKKEKMKKMLQQALKLFANSRFPFAGRSASIPLPHSQK
jgi:DNA polymerase elongation subunit (family B)